MTAAKSINSRVQRTDLEINCFCGPISEPIIRSNVCMYVCTTVSMYECTLMYVYMNVHECIYICVYICMSAYMHVHNIHMYVCVHVLQYDEWMYVYPVPMSPVTLPKPVHNSTNFILCNRLSLFWVRNTVVWLILALTNVNADQRAVMNSWFRRCSQW